jgi:hypothetical protein
MFCLDGFDQARTLANMSRPFLTEPPRWAVVVVVAVVLLVVGFVVFDLRRPARAEDDDYKRQLTALERVWVMGRQAGEFLESKRLARTEANCSRLYRATMASRFPWENKDLVEMGRLVFNRGCDRDPEESAPSDVLLQQPSGL